MRKHLHIEWSFELRAHGTTVEGTLLWTSTRWPTWFRQHVRQLVDTYVYVGSKRKTSRSIIKTPQAFRGLKVTSRTKPSCCPQILCIVGAPLKVHIASTWQHEPSHRTDNDMTIQWACQASLLRLRDELRVRKRFGWWEQRQTAQYTSHQKSGKKKCASTHPTPCANARTRNTISERMLSAV